LKLSDLNERILLCNKCELNKLRSFGYGNINSKIMFIGQNPGKRPEYSMIRSHDIIPFALNLNLNDRPNAGYWFGKLLTYFNLTVNDFYITNIIKCPRKDSNNAPNKLEISNCSDFLNAEIRIQKPKIIIGLGGSSKNVLQLKEFGRKGIKKEEDIIKISMWHPGFVNRYGGKNFKEWILQLECIKDSLQQS